MERDTTNPPPTHFPDLVEAHSRTGRELVLLEVRDSGVSRCKYKRGQRRHLGQEAYPLDLQAHGPYCHLMIMVLWAA